jgi:hypothetical protein
MQAAVVAGRVVDEGRRVMQSVHQPVSGATPFISLVPELIFPNFRWPAPFFHVGCRLAGIQKVE